MYSKTVSKKYTKILPYIARRYLQSYIIIALGIIYTYLQLLNDVGIVAVVGVLRVVFLPVPLVLLVLVFGGLLHGSSLH